MFFIEKSCFVLDFENLIALQQQQWQARSSVTTTAATFGKVPTHCHGVVKAQLLWRQTAA